MSLAEILTFLRLDDWGAVLHYSANEYKKLGNTCHWQEGRNPNFGCLKVSIFRMEILRLDHFGCLILEPYYLGTDFVLKSWFMTFGFSKSPFVLIFKLFWFLNLKKWLSGFILKCWLSYLSQILTSILDFRQFLTFKSIYCIIFGYAFSDFCNNHEKTNCEMLKKMKCPNKIWEKTY